jgi:uncharacterized protein (DUF58 family)
MEEVSYRLVMENHGLFPLYRISLQFEKEVCDIREESELSLLPWQQLEFMLPLSCRYAGTYAVGLLTYTVHDAFGLFSYTFSVPSKCPAIVRPRIKDDYDMVARYKHRLPDHSRQPDLFEDVLGGNLKSYHPGDPIHAIHWPNYARTGEAYIRTPEEESIGRVHILLDPVEKVEGIEELKRRDLFLEYVVSLAHGFLKQGKPVDFSYPSGKLKTVVIVNWQDFFRFWNEMPEEISHPHTEHYLTQKEEKIRFLSSAGEEWLCLRETDFTGEGRNNG